MKPFLLTATALALCLAGRAAAQTAGATGDWELTWETPRDEVTQALTLHQNGNALTGTLEMRPPRAGMQRAGGGGRPGGQRPGGERGPMRMDIESGSVDGNTITFRVVRQMRGRAMEMEFTGTLDGDTMSGTVRGMFGGGETEWTTVRASP